MSVPLVPNPTPPVPNPVPTAPIPQIPAINAVEIENELWNSEHSLNNLLNHESSLMGQDIHEAHLQDKIHYSKAAAYADNPGYQLSDKTELKNMDNEGVWEPIPVSQLTQNEQQDICRCHLLRYPKWTGKVALVG